MGNDVPYLLHFIPHFKVICLRHIMHFGQLHTLSAQSILSRTKQIKAHIFHQSNAECFRITDNGQSFPLVPQLQISFLHQIFSIGSILQQPISYAVQFAMIWQKLFFKTFSVHGLFINSRFLFIPFRRRGKGFCYTTRKKKWKKNENTNSTSPRVRLFQDISNPLFKIQFCNVFRLQLKLHQHLRCGESVFLL